MDDVIVGVDPSDTARKAAATAASLAAACGVNLHLVTCVKPGRSEQVGVGSDTITIDPVSDAEGLLRRLSAELPHDRITTHIAMDDPAEALCAEAQRLGARMIVVGNRRVQGMSRVLGSVATDVLRNAPCDVHVANTTGA